MRYCGLLVVLATFLLVVGCGGSKPPEEKHVTGDVTYDGKPIQEGTVTYTPKSGGTPSSCKLKGGVYTVEAPPGSYAVEVESPEIKSGGGKKSMDVEVPKESPRKSIRLTLKSK